MESYTQNLCAPKNSGPALVTFKKPSTYSVNVLSTRLFQGSWGVYPRGDVINTLLYAHHRIAKQVRAHLKPVCVDMRRPTNSAGGMEVVVVVDGSDEETEEEFMSDPPKNRIDAVIDEAIAISAHSSGACSIPGGLVIQLEELTIQEWGNAFSGIAARVLFADLQQRTLLHNYHRDQQKKHTDSSHADNVGHKEELQWDGTKLEVLGIRRRVILSSAGRPEDDRTGATAFEYMRRYLISYTTDVLRVCFPEAVERHFGGDFAEVQKELSDISHPHPCSPEWGTFSVGASKEQTAKCMACLSIVYVLRDISNLCMSSHKDGNLVVAAVMKQVYGRLPRDIQITGRGQDYHSALTKLYSPETIKEYREKYTRRRREWMRESGNEDLIDVLFSTPVLDPREPQDHLYTPADGAALLSRILPVVTRVKANVMDGIVVVELADQTAKSCERLAARWPMVGDWPSIYREWAMAMAPEPPEQMLTPVYAYKVLRGCNSMAHLADLVVRSIQRDGTTR